MEIVRKTIDLLDHQYVYYIIHVLMICIIILLLVYAFKGWFI